ncbi:hypothetical protein DL93DRAFT_2167317 [Clavulina sp. PMI_390]|nr:hypothetical protein DL93DRAFT_2167317 [Clavulina sp. PMI_390]
MPPESIAGSFKSSSGRNDAKILPSTNDSPRKHSTSVTLDPSPKDKIPQTTHAPSETPINHHNPYILNGPPDLDQNLTIAPFHLPEATITELDSFHLNALPAQAHLIPSAQPGIAYTFNGWALADNAELVNIFLSLQPQIGLNLHPDRLRRLFIVDLFYPMCPLLPSHAPLIRESMRLVVALFASAPDGSLTALNRVREERTMLTQGMVHYFDAYSYLLAHEAVVTSLIMEGWYLLQNGLTLHQAEKLFAHLNTHIELSGLQGFEQLSAPPLRKAWLAIIPDPIHTAERVNLCWSVRALDLAVAQQLGTPPKTQLGNSDENVLSIRPVSYSGVEEMRAFSHGWWALISKSMHYEFMNQHQPMGP